MPLKHFNSGDIASMEQRYRASFINSLGGFKSAVMVGTINSTANTNLTIFNSLFHIGANPPLCGLIFRPDTVFRHTLENIMETGEYTINHFNQTIYQQAHQTSARYERSVSEFEATGLSPEFHDLLKAPYVQQSHLKFGMRMEERIDLKINGTILMIGRIAETFVPEECIGQDGFVDIEKAGTVTVSGLDSYHTTRKLSRLSYAKPDRPPELLK